jgi:hypothetical protein
MAGEDVWSFISYAHDDNLPTGGGQDEEGFVSFLQRMLEVKLRDLGAQEAKLWRDAKRFSGGDPYDVAVSARRWTPDNLPSTNWKAWDYLWRPALGLKSFLSLRLFRV